MLWSKVRCWGGGWHLRRYFDEAEEKGERALPMVLGWGEGGMGHCLQISDAQHLDMAIKYSFGDFFSELVEVRVCAVLLG